jgi:carboxyl-terminal processing protease
MKKFYRALCLIVLLFALLSQSAPAQLKYNRAAESNIVAPEKLSPEGERRLETFRLVWQTIKDNYFDQTFSGLNWNKIRAEFEPRVLQSKSDAELHTLLQEMINRLNKSHFVIIPPEVFKEIGKAKSEFEDKAEASAAAPETGETEAPVEEEEAETPTHYGVGIDIRFINNQVVITQIEKDSPAAKAGLKTGYVIEQINGVSLKTFLEKFRQNTVYAKVYEKQLSGLLLSFIDGDDGGTVSLGFRDEKEQLKETEVERASLKGDFVKILSGLPAQFLTFESKSLNEETGYIRFNGFALKTVEKFCAAITQFKNKKAIVIDMRGNFGGNFGALFGITSLLTDKGLIIGTEINKYGKIARRVQPQIKNFKGKLVVLTDAESYSAAEIFASGLKENNRATIIGETTAGSALPALTMALPTGAVLLYPVANFETPKGNLLEGKGVEPNIKIALDRKSLLEGKDLQLAAAIDFLKEEVKKLPLETPKTDATFAIPPPPPPKPAVLGSVVVGIPAIPARKDEKALKIIEEYIEAVGGRENLKKLNSFSATGSVEMKQAGSVVAGEAEIYRKFPNKVAKVMKIESLGEVSEVFDGAKSFIQTDFMGTQRNEMWTSEINLAANFRELLDAREIYHAITFESVYENEGRKINLVKALTKQGILVYFAFDVETKFLISRAGASTSAHYGDYRKIGEWRFPFHISEGGMTFKLREIKPNAPIDDSRFAEKESCFTKID